MTQFDRHLAAESELDFTIYYRSTRGKFLEILQSLECEPFSSLLEIGTSEFPFLLKRVRGDLQLSTLNLTPPQSRWCVTDGVECLVGDVLAPPLPVPDASQDVIVFSEVLEHLQGNPRLAFGEFARVLKPGGRLIITTPNLGRYRTRVKLLLGISPMEPVGGLDWCGHFREYTRAEVINFCVTAGLEIVRADFPMYWDTVDQYLDGGRRGYVNGRFYYRPYFTGLTRVLVRPALHVLEGLLRLLPVFRYAMLVVARRPGESAPVLATGGRHRAQ